MGLLRRDSEGFLEDRGKVADFSVSTLKVLPGGEIVCNSLQNWDLLLLAPTPDGSSYVEKKRI